MQITIGFGWIAMLLIVLKLTGVVAWSWWLILLPLYAPSLFAFVFIISALAFGVMQWKKLGLRRHYRTKWR